MLPISMWKMQCTLGQWGPALSYRWHNISPLVKVGEFSYKGILEDALRRQPDIKAEGLVVPDEDWWNQLILSCDNKAKSKYGSYLLRERVVHSLSQRLGVEHMYEKYGQEIEECALDNTTFFVGLPRSETHSAAHMATRSGLFYSTRGCDALFPSEPTDFLRTTKSKKWIKKHLNYWHHPFLQCARTTMDHKVEDDTWLQLHCPKSIAWGMFHGLDDHLYKCIQDEDQQLEVFKYQRRVYKLFKWYAKNGHFEAENPCGEISAVEDQISHGTKDDFDDLPFVVQSPLGLCNIESLHRAFPDCRIIWTHRALNRCIPSMCHAVASHNTMYTGRRPTQTQLAAIGEQVVGFFSSGSENAVDYMGNFPMERLVHWHNVEMKRSLTRLLSKTLQGWGYKMDFYHHSQCARGYTEYMNYFRPRPDVDPAFFGLHEGQIHEAFEAYLNQFEEYAIEDPHAGVKMQSQDNSLSSNAMRDFTAIGSGTRAGRPGTRVDEFKHTQLGWQASPIPGHSNLEGRRGRPDDLSTVEPRNWGGGDHKAGPYD